ncbi:MAG: hypothetical protein N7Q72_04505, partial [Spiroplasma sp. Tabriz.8]|nr:hypothetical protein [Spiroplasma sp. Tabriz.8]
NKTNKIIIHKKNIYIYYKILLITRETKKKKKKVAKVTAFYIYIYIYIIAILKLYLLSKKILLLLQFLMFEKII